VGLGAVERVNMVSADRQASSRGMPGLMLSSGSTEATRPSADPYLEDALVKAVVTARGLPDNISHDLSLNPGFHPQYDQCLNLARGCI